MLSTGWLVRTRQETGMPGVWRHLPFPAPFPPPPPAAAAPFVYIYLSSEQDHSTSN